MLKNDKRLLVNIKEIASFGQSRHSCLCSSIFRLTTLVLIKLEAITLLFIITRTVLLSSIQPEAETSTAQPTHFREIFRKSSHYVNTKKGSVVKQSGNDVDDCRSQKVCFNPISAYFCNAV